MPAFEFIPASSAEVTFDLPPAHREIVIIFRQGPNAMEDTQMLTNGRKCKRKDFLSKKRKAPKGALLNPPSPLEGHCARMGGGSLNTNPSPISIPLPLGTSALADLTQDILGSPYSFIAVTRWASIRATNLWKDWIHIPGREEGRIV